MPRRSTVDVGHLGELVARAVEATAASPKWRDRVTLTYGFTEDAVRTLVSLLDDRIEEGDDAAG